MTNLIMLAVLCAGLLFTGDRNMDVLFILAILFFSIVSAGLLELCGKV